MYTLKPTEQAERSARLMESNVLIAGLKFRADNFKEFLDAIDKVETEEDIIGLRLVKDLNNDYDPNAIKVMGYIEIIGNPSVVSTFHIGFLPKPIARKLKDDGVNAERLFAALTKMSATPPKAHLDIYSA
ncbi:MAG: hypothetical protein COA43_03620 [Robiginitomaculum sp.]|nr:MAG: hypothetical protein COA43_03620 [Robiginitomaculum sp.]